MKVEALPAIKGNHNLANYEEAYASFDWKEVEENFSWSKTGKINAAYEAIDRHADGAKKK